MSVRIQTMVLNFGTESHVIYCGWEVIQTNQYIEPETSINEK